MRTGVVKVDNQPPTTRKGTLAQKRTFPQPTHQEQLVVIPLPHQEQGGRQVHHLPSINRTLRQPTLSVNQSIG
ncbi:hypothetical protein JTE90_005291 [Oedothorax gibbosus]|uniref:Uncharacterized protein n=1 Tax=Oedothorax gibbosus TaxID=931172 RepID=A0AAV6U4G1_9ARAC|nr:hypothetical protein JTE90_005291 [Oedothorax gibbosus]